MQMLSEGLDDPLFAGVLDVALDASRRRALVSAGAISVACATIWVVNLESGDGVVFYR
ncbi:MAG: hypothetical protein V3T86_08845 [Planctomycetota bacterium]